MRFLKSVRAVSPVIAVLLTIAIVVVASLVAYSWIMGYIGNTTMETSKAILIQSVANSTSPYPVEVGNLTIYVQNVGEGTIQLGSQCVYVNSALRSVVSIQGSLAPSFPFDIKSGNTVSLVVNFPITNQGPYDIKVVSLGGTVSERSGVIIHKSQSSGDTASPIIHGVISIAFDDGTQNQYDNAFPILQSYNLKATFYVITDRIEDISHDDSMMSFQELQTLQANGNEIGSHSKSHPWFPDLSDDEIRQECSISKQTLLSHGLDVNNFAYPYGGTTVHTDSIVTQYYRSARTAYTEPYQMPIGTTQTVIPSCPGESNVYLYNEIDSVASSNTWKIIFFHNVVDQYTDPPDPYSISSSDFSNFLNYVISKGVEVKTVNEALNLDPQEVQSSFSSQFDSTQLLFMIISILAMNLIFREGKKMVTCQSSIKNFIFAVCKASEIRYRRN